MLHLLPVSATVQCGVQCATTDLAEGRENDIGRVYLLSGKLSYDLRNSNGPCVLVLRISLRIRRGRGYGEVPHRSHAALITTSELLTNIHPHGLTPSVRPWDGVEEFDRRK